jgi:translation initiation factor 5
MDLEPNGKPFTADVLDDDDDDWAPEPVAGELSAQIGKLVIDQDLDKSVEDRLQMLHDYFKQQKEAGSLGDGKQLLNEAERLDLKTKAPLLLVLVLFTKDILNELTTYRTIFLRFCLDNKKGQRYLLGGIEQFLEKNPDLLPRAPHIVKALYDKDLCTEESILAWGMKVSRIYCLCI